jgi:hypothetical protein
VLILEGVEAMILSIKRALVMPVVVLVVSGMAFADVLPKAAVPLTPEQIKTLYADHSTVWGPKRQAFFSVDGTVKGFSDDNVFSGIWRVANDQICMDAKGTNSKTKKSDGKIYTDCWQWAIAGGKYWAFYSNSYAKTKFDKVGGWNRSEIKTLKKADLVSAKYAAMGGT